LDNIEGNPEKSNQFRTKYRNFIFHISHDYRSSITSANNTDPHQTQLKHGTWSSVHIVWHSGTYLFCRHWYSIQWVKLGKVCQYYVDVSWFKLLSQG